MTETAGLTSLTLDALRQMILMKEYTILGVVALMTQQKPSSVETVKITTEMVL
jgi:hypothetical protein